MQPVLRVTIYSSNSNTKAAECETPTPSPHPLVDPSSLCGSCAPRACCLCLRVQGSKFADIWYSLFLLYFLCSLDGVSSLDSQAGEGAIDRIRFRIGSHLFIRLLLEARRAVVQMLVVCLSPCPLAGRDRESALPVRAPSRGGEAQLGNVSSGSHSQTHTRRNSHDLNLQYRQRNKIFLYVEQNKHMCNIDNK